VLDPNLGNEIRLTLIATGFATKDALAGAAWEKEVMKLLKGAKTEEELEIPSYLRQRRVLPAQRTIRPSGGNIR
jgi:cell division protein FtsZ